MHINIAPVLHAGIPPIITVGFTGIHGEVVFGIHGIGVKTPSAAAVAAATVGLANDVHIPKGSMFKNGMFAFMFLVGVPPKITLSIGMLLNKLGLNPKVHVIVLFDDKKLIL